MKKINFIGLSLFIFFLGCHKPGNSKPPLIDNSVIGKWTYTEYFYSTGAPGSWYPVAPAEQTIEFKQGGSFIGTESFLKGATQFEMVDSVTIKFQPTTGASGFTLMGYKINKEERNLYLYPVNPICIEGCSNKFHR